MVLWHHSYIEIKWSSLYLSYNFRYTALTTLGIRQEAEQIMANVFYLTFLNVFKFFLERFFLHLCFEQEQLGFMSQNDATLFYMVLAMNLIL